MSFEDLLNLSVSIFRKTDQLFSGAIAASIELTYQPPTNSVLFLEVADLVGSGTLTVSGTVGGSPDTEVFTFSADGFLQGEKKFTAVTSITNSGITSGTLTVKAKTPSGGELYEERLVASDVKARISEKRSFVTIGTTGAELSSGYRMYVLPDTDILENDIVVNGSTRYNVFSVIPKTDFSEEHHKTVEIRLEALSA